MLLKSFPHTPLGFINLADDESLYGAGHQRGEPCDFFFFFFFFTSFKCNYHHLSEKKQSGVAREVLVFTTFPFYVPFVG